MVTKRFIACIDQKPGVSSQDCRDTDVGSDPGIRCTSVIRFVLDAIDAFVLSTIAVVTPCKSSEPRCSTTALVGVPTTIQRSADQTQDLESALLFMLAQPAIKDCLNLLQEQGSDAIPEPIGRTPTPQSKTAWKSNPPAP
jgi:hypothetical protein